MHENTRELRADIEETRERMSGTLDELGERLNPRRLRQQAKENIREATIGRVTNMASNARHTVMDTVRDNPVPAAMIGVGIGWLLFNGRRDDDVAHYLKERDLEYRGNIGAATPRLRQDDAAGGVGASVSSADDGNVISRTAHRVTDTVEDVGDRAQHIAHEVVDTTRHQARRLEDRFARTLQDNPLVIGLAAMAVGLAAGLAIPETRKESELMGRARDQVVDEVRERASELGEKVQRVAERAADEASNAARDERINT